MDQTIISKKRKQNKKWHASYHLQIGSKQMFHDLKKLGLAPRKSKTLQLPKIPQKYFADFVRGYFDGDGHVAVYTYLRKNRNNQKYIILQSGFTSGSKSFLKKLQQKLKRLANLGNGSLTFLKNYSRLRYSINDSIKLYNFMYGSVDNHLFLRRKQKIFQKYINGPVV
ncbi:LAGLIDADG family homing endonuclease [Patescibacteria group bacterium]|nr:LAGLIDADG family homing endonuclease [Patescibacteria group bacterium]